MAQLRKQKPVSRIDSKNTHGYLARVYRAEWSRGKMFSDGVYGSAAEAERAAWAWQKQVDARLPRIPRKPVLKVAKFRLRKNGSGRYYDVYLPMPGRARHQTRTLYFSKLQDMENKATIARQLVDARNAVLVNAHRLAYAAWKKEHDRIMKQILEMWPAVKKGRLFEPSDGGNGERA